MASFISKLKGASLSTGATSHKKKDDAANESTPLEKMLQNAGTIRHDGSDKFFGLENFGNTCYCNSIVQALYHSVQFRQAVLKYYPFSSNLPNGHAKVNVQIRPQPDSPSSPTKTKALSSSEAMKRRQAINSGTLAAGPHSLKPEDKPDTPEYKKKHALQKGPVLELAQEHSAAYGMGECTFTGLKDIFAAMVDSGSRTGVVSPQRFLEIFKRDNENFQSSQHQDAHEFYGLVLNDVINTIEENARKMVQGHEMAHMNGSASLGNGHAVAPSHANGVAKHPNSASRSQSLGLGAGWVHDIFEGLLTSETKCLACETTSQRDETFLDLSIDLEEHSSVTSCLKNFSAEEMLCERNKFHCDTCGGLQEAEKRMKVKSMPKVLALHLKRFKYTEDYSRLQKLFHRVVYPYYLRMFNTTDDVEDPDRLYELYAVVIHIGGNAYHGHYVSVVKTQDRGWLLFDDEMVEPVDKHFVKNFFGDKPGQACAYLLLYQEITFDKALADQELEGYLDVEVDDEGRVSVGETGTHENGVAVPSPSKEPVPNGTSEDSGTDAPFAETLEHASTMPYSNGTAIPPITRSDTGAKTKSEQKKEAKAAEKARKVVEKERLKAEAAKRKENLQKMRDIRRAEQEDIQQAIQASLLETNHEGTSGDLPASTPTDHPTPLPSTPYHVPGIISRANRGSKTMAKKSFAFLNREKKEDGTPDSSITSEIPIANGHANRHHHHPGDRAVSASHAQLEKIKGRLSFNLGRKKSAAALS